MLAQVGGRLAVNQALVLGPLALPYAMLLLFVAAGTGLYVGERVARKAGVSVEAILWRTLLVGVLASRLAFVWEFRAVYLADPLGILDIRDGGWSPTAGFVVAWLYVLSRLGKAPVLRRPLQVAMLSASVLWLAGTVALAVRPGPGPQMPALVLPAPDGQNVPLDSFRGKPVVINLWATWCPPCVREMPVLLRAQAEHPGVHFVFVNQSEAPEKVAAWLRARNLGLRNVLLDDTGRVGAAFGQRALPTTLFFDAQGRLVSLRVGELSAATLGERLRALQP